MAININELSLTVTGNVVKNNDEGKDTVLRMTEDQAREIKADLDSYFERNPKITKDPVAPANKLVESNSASE